MAKKRLLKNFISFLLTFSLGLTAYSTVSYADVYFDAMETNKALPVQSNQIDNWPVGPSVGAYSAILMDANTGVILYEKNIDEKMFPASTTKLISCLIAMESEKTNLNDMVYFSEDAVMSVPRDASNMGMDVGEEMTVEECLYGILVVSANEVCNALAEYVCGDIDSFVDLMNERAKELGCTHTHFNNSHGYTDPNHYTTAHDLALIANAFFKNELLAKISRTPTYHWYATDTQPDDIVLGSTNYFMKGRYECDGIIGSKTGFTDESRQVLVTCAERNDLRLICVVMQEETPYQYDDTLSLLNYGFSNFNKIKVSDYDSKYTITDNNFFHSKSAVFGDTSDILSFDRNSYIILPKTISFEDLNSSIEYTNDSNSHVVASVNYYYDDVYLGNSDIVFSNNNENSFVFDETEPVIEETEDIEKEKLTINLDYIVYGIAALFAVILITYVIRKLLLEFHFGPRVSFIGRRRKKRREKKNLSYKKMSTKAQKFKNKNNENSSYINLK